MEFSSFHEDATLSCDNLQGHRIHVFNLSGHLFSVFKWLRGEVTIPGVTCFLSVRSRRKLLTKTWNWISLSIDACSPVLLEYHCAAQLRTNGGFCGHLEKNPSLQHQGKYNSHPREFGFSSDTCCTTWPWPWYLLLLTFPLFFSLSLFSWHTPLYL
jgi:hypothetical protein